MPARQRAQAKNPAEGASASRGARHSSKQVKQEPSEGNLSVTSELLRKTIINRRQARGLGEIQVHFVDSVKHELTPEEMEKKERRKEQNRRAARKCRMKKKNLQNIVASDYSKVIADNQKMEQEISELRAQRDSLQKLLDDHRLSGQCVHIKHDSPGAVPASPATMTSSPSTTSLSSMSSASTTACSPAPAPPAPAAATALAPIPAQQTTAEQFEVDNQTYLGGLGPIEPELTFTDLELDMLADLSQFLSPEDCNNNNLQPSVQIIASDQLPPSSFSATTSSSSSPFLSQLSADPLESLKTLMPANSRSSCFSQSLFSPVSPASHHHDRHSVSSVASDWSSVSEQSQGFLVPVNASGSPGHGLHMGGARLAFGSSSETEAMDVSCYTGDFCAMQRMVPSVGGEGYEEDEDVEDEVFNGGSGGGGGGGGGGDDNLFQQYAYRH